MEIKGRKSTGHSKDSKRNRRRRKETLFWTAGILISVAVLFFSGWQLGKILWGYHSAIASYSELAEQMETELATLPAVEPPVLAVNEDSLSEVEPEKLPEETTDSGDSALAAYSITVPDFAYLQSINQDVVGWIQIPGTVINYPVVQGSDNEFYLTHTYTGQENSSGALFMDAGISDGFEDKNPIIYGHNLKSGAMFSRLNRYARADFWQANPWIYITTPENGQMIYQVFSAYQCTPDAPVYYYGFGETAEYEEYLDQLMEYSIFNAGISVTKEDSIVTLSTCANDTEYRFVVHAKRIQ